MTQTASILIVDDEENLRQTMARILQRAGYDITTASDGKACLDLLNKHHFDMMYLDIRMPKLSGLEVLKKIHEFHPSLPVVLFTAQPDITSAIQALRHGAIDYLIKPLKPEQVIERTKVTLNNILKERRKNELSIQIKSLEAELKSLDKPENQISVTEKESGDTDRFLRRGKLVLDLHRYQATLNKHTVNLPMTAFKYLLALARHAPDVVNYRTLVAEAQGYEADARESQELAKWHIHHIRQALETRKKGSAIINVRGTGYRLVID